MRYGWVSLLALGCSPDAEAPPGGDGPPVQEPEPSVPVEPNEPADLPSVVINEVMPGNESTLTPPSSDLKPDWIELVNTGAEPVPLSALTLRNGDGELWTGATTDGDLPPGEHVIVYLGEGDGVAGLWTGFTLDKDGDKLTLLAGEGVVSYVDFDAVESDIALARIPELTGDLVATAWATPGAANGDAPSPTLNPANETLFRTDVVHELAFSMTPEAYNKLDQNNRPEVHVGLSVDGVEYADIGLKLKGSASYAPMSAKPAFIVDFNNWIAGTKYRGLKAFKLHNGNVLDPTRTRDHLSYRLAREAGLMAPRVGWAHVTVNGNDYGIYMIIEKHDDDMIEYHHPGLGATGVVIEPNESQAGGWGGGDFGNGNLDWNFEEGPVPPDPLTVAALQNADRLIGSQVNDERVEELWGYVNKEQFLTYLAWETIVMHLDGYRSPNNWRLYVDPATHLIEWVPSGAEWTWDWALTTWTSGGNAAEWCFANPGCRFEYAEKVVLVADLADQLDLIGDFEALSQFLDPWIASDPRYTGGAVGPARSSTRGYLESNPRGARNDVFDAFPELAP